MTPSGIVMASSSVGATQEAIEKVLTENGHEPEKPAAAAVETPVEPKREDFKTDEEFAEAQETFATAQEEAEEAAEAARLAALPKKSRRQKAVEKATKDLKDENRRLADRVAALEGRGGEKKEPVAAAPKAPERKDFKTDAEYDDAMFDYRYQLRRAKEQAEQSKTALEAKMRKNFTHYQTSVPEFKEEHDDWDDVVNQELPIPDPVYFAIVDLGKEGPAVTYYLGQHPEEIDRLGEMTPYRAAIEVGRLADKLKSKTPGNAERKIPPKKLPAPVTPVSTSATTSSLTSREAANNKDFKAFKAAQRRGA
jgi:hypothetical protein